MEILPVFAVFLPYLTAQIVPTNGNMDCSTKLDVCPPGHQMRECPKGTEGYFCKQCGELSFQPNENRFGDRCRLRKMCDISLSFMDYKEYGSTIKDADCKCLSGYHFEADDQRACVPNRECNKGFGQGPYGRCLDCLSKNMYSDKKNRLQTCIPLSNCEKLGRCTVKKSNGTYDNTCGPIVRDVSKCEDMVFDNTVQPATANTGLIIGCSLGAVALLVIVIIIIIYIWRKRQARNRKSLTESELEELRNHIIRKAEDKTYCEKVLSQSFRVIEDRIDRQRWKLAQELFRNHFQPSKYEVIVEKYKESSEKYAVNGYLQDWREWKSSCPQAIAELFTCLKKCEREDIMYEICNHFHDDECINMTYEGNANKRTSKPSVFEGAWWCNLPCTKTAGRQQDSVECKDTNSKLLEVKAQDTEMKPKDAGEIFRKHPSPSAPVFFDDNNSVAETPVYNRALSYPVQASS